MSRLDETYIAFNNPIDQLEKGIEYCRNGDWQSGFSHLSVVAAQQRKPGELPSRYYSYLGYGMALQQKRLKEGIKLCQYAIKQEFYQLENYVNLARTYLLARRRGLAYRTIENGLKIDPNYPDLLKLLEKLGSRRPPVLSFLSRSNPLNLLLGRIRHSAKAPKKKKTVRKPAAKKPRPGGARRRPAGRPR